MEKYRFSVEQQALIESLEVPFAIYQFLDKRVVTIALTKGFCDLLGYENKEDAYYDMDNDMYKDAYPDDIAKIENAAVQFARGQKSYDVVYRSKLKGGTEYNMIHAVGKHVFTESGVRLAQVYYINEGIYNGSNDNDFGLAQMFNNSLNENTTKNENYYDYLTGLPSMKHFFEIAEATKEKLLKEKKRPVLLFLDFSGMKFYNSKYGFAEGDRLLRAFSRLLVKYYGNENCSRFGQDHFAAITYDNDLEKTINKIFSDTEKLNGGKTLPLRVGIYKSQMEPIETSIACDRAKLACNALRNTYVSGFSYFDEEMKKSVDSRQYIIDNIDKAISKKWIQVYYQPIVRTVNGKVCNEEALARWCDPVKGIIMPSDFVPILESVNLAYKLDLYVVDEILRKIKRQEEAGLYVVPQSVNLSRSDFDVCDIVEEIRKKVDEAGVDRDQLKIEITEGVIGINFEFIKEHVERFQKLGFSVWMDDFGSGYSSLNLLQNIRFDLVKFDMRFIKHIADNTNNNNIVLQELIKMTTALGMDTICEGVENKEQVIFLQEIGCSKIQGFYFRKPLSFEMLLADYKKGTKLGYEPSEQTWYYETISRVNLYDSALITSGFDSTFHGDLDAMPMGIIEVTNSGISFARCNHAFKEFMLKIYSFNIDANDKKEINESNEKLLSFVEAMRSCISSTGRMFIDEELPDYSIAHFFVRRIAYNKENDATALVIGVMSIATEEDGATYASIARALSADYFNMFYVNLETEEFIEYDSQVGHSDMIIQRHSDDFFNKARSDALRRVYPEDRLSFVNSLTKENIIKDIKSQGAFSMTYRLMTNGMPVYVNMKASAMNRDGKYIIVAVSNVDSQMKQKEKFEKIRQEQLAYTRINALMGDYICLYVVDPINGKYHEYRSTQDYEAFGLEKGGDNFFNDGRVNIRDIILKEDLEGYLSRFTKDNILSDIEKSGLFSMHYHLIINNKPVPVNLRATIVEEIDGDKLVVGVMKERHNSEKTKK